MGYDPNDPNQGSQDPNSGAGGTGDFSNPGEQDRLKASLGQGIDQLIKSRPAIAQWLATHNGGRNLSDVAKAELYGLIRSQGIDTTLVELKDDGHFTAGTDHTGRDILSGLLLAFGPVAVVAAIPAVAGIVGAAGAPAAGATGAGGASAVGAGAAPLAATTTVPAVGALATGGTGLVGGTAPLAASATTSAVGGLAPALSSGSSTAPFVAGGGNSIYGPTAATGGSAVTDALKTAIPTAGNIVSGLIQANAAGNASDKQIAYLEEALAYQKEQDAQNRQLAANKVQLEANRYATYSGNTAPFIANGVTSGNRMTALLGLPQGAPSAGGGPVGGGSGGSGGGTNGVSLTPDITAKVNDYYKSIGVTPTGPGSGPTDAAYYAGKVAETGGLTPDNIGYWFGPSGRIASDLGKAGVKTGTPPPPSGAPPATYGTQPPPSSAPSTVTLKAPDGSTKQVPSSQLSYWLGKGAQQVSA